MFFKGKTVFLFFKGNKGVYYWEAIASEGVMISLSTLRVQIFRSMFWCLSGKKRSSEPQLITMEGKIAHVSFINFYKGRLRGINEEICFANFALS